MKALSSAVVLGIGFLMVSGSPARAQFGDLGEAAKKGATDAAKQEIMKGVAEKAGLPTPGTPAVTPAATAPAGESKGTPAAAETPAAAPKADTGGASAPVGEPKVAPEAAAPAADTGAASAPVGEPKVAPEAAAPAGMPGMAETAEDAAGKAMKKKMPKLP